MGVKRYHSEGDMMLEKPKVWILAERRMTDDITDRSWVKYGQATASVEQVERTGITRGGMAEEAELKTPERRLGSCHDGAWQATRIETGRDGPIEVTKLTHL
jgi:hypothetical protein